MDTPTDAEVEAVSAVLADPDNSYFSAEQVAGKVLEALAQLRRRPWRYIVVAQDRSPRRYDMRYRFGVHPRRFYPTWAKGPFVTLADAGHAATAERRRAAAKVMTVEVFDPEDEVDPDKLKEVRK